MEFVRACIAFVQPDFYALGHLTNDAWDSRKGLVIQADGQAAEDVEAQSAGGYNLSFDGVTDRQ